MLLLIMPGYKRLTLTENKIKLLETYLTVIKNNPNEIVNMYFPSSVFSCIDGIIYSGVFSLHHRSIYSLATTVTTYYQCYASLLLSELPSIRIFLF